MSTAVSPNDLTTISAYGKARSTVSGTPLSPDELAKVSALDFVAGKPQRYGLRESLSPEFLDEYARSNEKPDNEPKYFDLTVHEQADVLGVANEAEAKLLGPVFKQRFARSPVLDRKYVREHASGALRGILGLP